VLANLERGQADDVGRPHLARNRARPAPPAGQLQMFASPRDAVIRELLALDPDTMTPLQAMVVLADLRAKAQRA
jgi:hypothetical protein